MVSASAFPPNYIFLKITIKICSWLDAKILLCAHAKDANFIAFVVQCSQMEIIKILNFAWQAS
jgi:hypothetical protein